MANRWGNRGNSGWLYILGLQNHCRWWLQPWNQKTLAPWKKRYDQPRQHVKKKLCFWTVVLEKTLESSLDCKEIHPVHPKGDQSWIFTGTDAEAETPILWPPDVKNWLIGKDPDAGKDWGREEKGTTEDEMVGWHHWRDGLSLSKLRELVMDREAWRAAVHGVAERWTRLSDWTELNWIKMKAFCEAHHKQSLVAGWEGGWYLLFVISKYIKGGFPAGLVVWTLCFPCRGCGFNPWSGN